MPRSPKAAGHLVAALSRMRRYPDARSGAGSRVHSAGDRVEGLVGIAAERGDGADADHNDQGQHYGVLDRCRAVFTLQEFNHKSTQVTHVLNLLSEAWQSAGVTVSAPKALRPRFATGLPFRG